MIEKQIALEQQMTERSIEGYRKELEQSKQNNTFGCSKPAIKLISRILDDFASSIDKYLKDYKKGRPTKCSISVNVIDRLNDVQGVALVTARTILNFLWSKAPVQSLYNAIGQGLEDEYKMRQCREENHYYYDTILDDLHKRGQTTKWTKYITTGVFQKRLAFHMEHWTKTEKVQTGLVLANLFADTTGLIQLVDDYSNHKHYKVLEPSRELVEWFDDINDKLEVLQPLFLPMVCPPKEWTSVFEGGYISPYIKRNKLIKNNDREYLKLLETAKMPYVYTAINHLQNTPWQINNKILDTVRVLWEEGRAIAELPDREDETYQPYPYPEKQKGDYYTEEEKADVKKWKRETYEAHKRNVAKRSLRILTSQILRIAEKFKDYEEIFFPYQMDFRGRLYPIPVLLQPQGTDLAKGLLRFARGKPVDKNSINWLRIHGANMFGYDKESYKKRVAWVLQRHTEIQSIAKNPLDNRSWTEADKPFQFLAFCFEYSDYLDNPDGFITHLPIQLDGTCNGLQHYSALLRDKQGGIAVNLINSDKPHDIYAVVAHNLEEKLKNERDSNGHIPGNIHRSGDNTINLADLWLKLGINRKLTKRPVMVLPYGGTLLSCREYIEEYLLDNYTPNNLWKHFAFGQNPTDCIFKASVYLSKLLWLSIQDTLRAAIVGMDYLKKTARIINEERQYIEWVTPAGLLVRQNYKSRRLKEIKTELYGRVLKTTINVKNDDNIDGQRQLNGICPNFIHSLDAACLMRYLVKCKEAGIDSFMTVHDCYGVLAPDTNKSARLLREAFVEIYRMPILERFSEDVMLNIKNRDMPPIPEFGELNIEDVLESSYFFN